MIIAEVTTLVAADLVHDFLSVLLTTELPKRPLPLPKHTGSREEL